MLLLQLSTGSVDIVAARVADGCLHAVHLQALLERLDLLHGGGLHEGGGRVVQRDEVDVAERAAAEVDQGFHLGVRVVDSLNHGELIGGAAAGFFDVLLNGLMEARQRVLLDAGHKLVARALHGGVERDGKGELLGKLGESTDAGDDTARRNR